MIDAHIHLDQYNRELIRDSIYKWQEGGIDGVVAVASSLQSSYDILKLKQDYPAFVRAAIGHHPESPPPSATDLQELIDLVKNEKHHLSGIGEIGLPTYRRKELFEVHQEEKFVFVLEAFLNLAKSENLPVALHAVHNESKKVLSYLKKHHIQKAHFHWLKAPDNVVSDIIAHGYYISVTPEVCYRERDQKLARQVPVNQLLMETDGPWTYGDSFKERETSPLFLKEISHCLSNILTIPLKELTRAIDHNTNKLYRK